jgi:nitronate monooxygenase
MPLPAWMNGRLRIPVIAAPLFIVSNPALVIAQCKAGVIGSFPALNARPATMLDDWLHEIREALAAHTRANPDRPAAPFAVNQIVHKSNDRLEHDLEVCARHKVEIIITSLGARPELNDAVHAWGGMTLHDIITPTHARKAIEKGADGLIAVAAGAGGHAGTLSPLALMSEIRSWFDGPVALSGAIANGRSILAAQKMGADFGYIGSPFIATREANAVQPYKDMIVASGAEDIVYSNLFTGVHGNYLKASVAASGLDPDALPTADKSAMNFASTRDRSTEKKAWRDVWGAGQGIGAIRAVQPAGDLIADLARQYHDAKTASDRVTLAGGWMAKG